MKGVKDANRNKVRCLKNYNKKSDDFSLEKRKRSFFKKDGRPDRRFKRWRASISKDENAEKPSQDENLENVFNKYIPFQFKKEILDKIVSVPQHNSNQGFDFPDSSQEMQVNKDVEQKHMLVKEDDSLPDSD